MNVRLEELRTRLDRNQRAGKLEIVLIVNVEPGNPMFNDRLASPNWGVDEREWQSGKTLRRRSNCGHIHFN